MGKALKIKILCSLAIWKIKLFGIPLVPRWESPGEVANNQNSVAKRIINKILIDQFQFTTHTKKGNVLVTNPSTKDQMDLKRKTTLFQKELPKEAC